MINGQSCTPSHGVNNYHLQPCKIPLFCIRNANVAELQVKMTVPVHPSGHKTYTSKMSLYWKDKALL